MKKEIKGITLVALVVTIIVLLILAGIAINLTIGNNGLFERSKDAANTWRKAELNEQEEMRNFEGVYDNTLKDLGLDNAEPTIGKCEIDSFEVTFTIGSTWEECLPYFQKQLGLPSYYFRENCIEFSQYGEGWVLRLDDYSDGPKVKGTDKIIPNAQYFLGK